MESESYIKERHLKQSMELQHARQVEGVFLVRFGRFQALIGPSVDRHHVGLRTGRTMNIQKKTLVCHDVVELFGEYVDDELNPDLHERVARHVSECAHCRDFERSYRFVIEAASLMKPVETEMPLGARNRLREALNRQLGLSLPMVES